MGPVFGIKGGGAGGGRSQVVPMEDLNLHFTGDIHAVTSATNLLAAVLDAHLFHGNELGIDPGTITWRRCLDVNDRALRRVLVGLGTTAAGLHEERLRHHRRVGDDGDPRRVARSGRPARPPRPRSPSRATFDGSPVTAEELGAAGAMTVLLKEALKPNLIQTLEGVPAIVHAGPFANIAHGNNSLVADLLALRTADYVVTEGGFGSDMGFEKFVDIVCRTGGFRPSAVVLVATIRALRHHGGGDLAAGTANLERHIQIVGGLGISPVVAINRFPDDSDEDVSLVRSLARGYGAFAAEATTAYTNGPSGAAALAEAVAVAAERPRELRYAYELDDPIDGEDREGRPPGLRRGGDRAERRGGARSRAARPRGSTACRFAWRRRRSRSPTTRPS